jgi:hypothetical protein
MTDPLDFLTDFLDPPQMKILKIQISDSDTNELQTFRIRVKAIDEANLDRDNEALAVDAIFKDIATLLANQESTTIVANAQSSLLKQVASEINDIHTVESLHRTCRWGDGITELRETCDKLVNTLSVYTVQAPIHGNLADFLDPTPVNLIALADYMVVQGQIHDPNIKSLRDGVLEAYLQAVSTCAEVEIQQYLDQIGSDTL